MSDVHLTVVDGVVVEKWDDGSRTYTDFRTEPDTVRAYTSAENARADAYAAALASVVNDAATSSKLLTVDFPAMQAIIAQTNADIRTDPSQEIKDIARAVRRLTRKVENLTDGSD